MPCKRCRHFRRPCTFNVASTSHEKQTASDSDSLKELMDRQRCMESIIKFHFPNLALDINSLQRTCDALLSKSPRPMLDASINPAFLDRAVYTQPPGGPGIEEEDCTIDHVDGTTVRMFSLDISQHEPPC